MEGHKYRVAVYNNINNTEIPDYYDGPYDYWVVAHVVALNHDDTYPETLGAVERSTDGGNTWEPYSADENVRGKPAWVVHQELWEEAKKEGEMK